MAAENQPEEDPGTLPDVTRGFAGSPEQVALVGEALMTAKRLQRRLGVSSTKDVVYLGIAVLKAADGKEIIVRDPGSGIEQPISIAWR
jgi:hypothetical protein